MTSIAADPTTLLVKAYDLARRRSNDPSNQNGAVIVPKPNGLTNGGGAVPGWNHIRQEHPADWSRPKKYWLVEHAERHAIFQAARLGEICQGSTMYCPWAACPDCARAIIHAGIKHLVVHKERMDTTPDRWREQVDFALEMLSLSGVEIEYFSGKLNLDPIIVNGEEWVP